MEDVIGMEIDEKKNLILVKTNGTARITPEEARSYAIKLQMSANFVEDRKNMVSRKT